MAGSAWFEVAMEVKGAEEARRAIAKLRKTLGREGKSEMKDEALECARLLEQWMHSYIHPVSGRLDRAIQSKPYKGEIPAAFVRVDYKIAPHAHLVEFGTIHMAAKPFFRRAIVTASPLIVSRMTRKLERLAERGGAI